MDHALKLLAPLLFLGTAFAQRDPVETLAQVRDKLRDTTPANRYCVETIDRGYFRRAHPPDSPESCERINLDRKKGAKLKLDSTDRLRLAVSLGRGDEIFSWVQPGPFSGDVDPLVRAGPIGTGALGSYLNEIFGSPDTRFEFLGEAGTGLRYHFRVPIESSHFLVAAGDHWLPAGYEGTIVIDPAALEVVRLTMETAQLPPDTSMCEARATVEFQGNVAVRGDLRHVLRDARETDNITTFSSCASTPPATVAHSAAPPALPENLTVHLALDQPIDSETSAAGDRITATLTRAVLDSKSGRVLAPISDGALRAQGSRVSGRILRFTRQFTGARGFVLVLSFDTLEINGVASPFYAEKSSQGPLFFPARSGTQIVPAGYELEWRTSAIPK